MVNILRGTATLLLAGASALAAAKPSRPNVLFIAVDDLRTQLGCFGDSQMVTPNIDRLAANATRFTKHYTSCPICIPSRASLLTGTRSERTHQIYGKALWPKTPGVQTMGATFSNNGYYTVSLGKVWHRMKGDGANGEHFHVSGPKKLVTYALPRNSALYKAKKKSQLPAVEGPLDVPDEAYGDGMLAAAAVRELKVAAKRNEPFFMIVGFKKPHLPFNAPKKYWDLYDGENPPGTPTLTKMPVGAPAMAARSRHELWTYKDGFSFEQPPTGAAARRLRHAYAACISYVDAQVGKVLGELDRLRLRENTIIVLWSDHGYQLGHVGNWTKHTNYENAANSPLIISAPGFRRGDQVCERPVETCDLFPTLLDLTNLPPLRITDGASLRPLLTDPKSEKWNRVAYHISFRHMPIPGAQKACLWVGRAVRTDRYRYVEWYPSWNKRKAPVYVELYDYAPGAPGEARNLAVNPERSGLCKRLNQLLWNWEKQSTIQGKMTKK